ncbi:MAG TPA: hypothetical protein VEL76_36395 [Gemmataceae bacterium]|nr:hypothetical protein [Gemmataceae bacterium]
MRNLTAEQIGLDYNALLELVGKERALKLIGKEAIREWLQREEQADAQKPADTTSPSTPPLEEGR